MIRSHGTVTWCRIHYDETQITQWDFQNKGTCTSPARLSFVLEVPLRHLRPSVIYSVPCDRIMQRAHSPLKTRAKMCLLSLAPVYQKCGSKAATCNMQDFKVKNDHRSKFSNLSNWKEEA